MPSRLARIDLSKVQIFWMKSPVQKFSDRYGEDQPNSAQRGLRDSRIHRNVEVTWLLGTLKPDFKTIFLHAAIAAFERLIEGRNGAGVFTRPA